MFILFKSVITNLHWILFALLKLPKVFCNFVREREREREREIGREREREITKVHFDQNTYLKAKFGLSCIRLSNM